MKNIYFYSLFVFFSLTSECCCVTHWKITDSGRVESNDDSAFALLRPYDLAAFIKQVDRFERLNFLKKILASKDTISKRDSYKNTPISVASYQENFYKSDSDCINAGQQLAKFSFYETHFTTWRSESMNLPKDIMNIDQADVKIFKKPFCDSVELPFTMGAFDHLESIQSRKNITMLPETEISSNLLVDSEDFYGHLVYKSMKLNATSWVYLTMASDYFRVKGDYSNSIMCLQRAIHYSSKQFKSIPLLNLANMLHKLHFVNDSLIVGLTGYSIDNKNPLLSYYVANIYVTLGQLNTSYIWFSKAANLDPQFKQTILKKYAVSCHIKLQKYLEEQHVNLQKKLEELNNFQGYSDEWFQLNNKLMVEKSSYERKQFTQNVYNHFVKNSKSTICDWYRKENNVISEMNCKKIPIHYTHFVFHNQTEFERLFEYYRLKSENEATQKLHTNESEDLNSNTCSKQNNDNCIRLKQIATDSYKYSKNSARAMSTNLERVLNENLVKRQVFLLDGSVISYN